MIVRRNNIFYIIVAFATVLTMVSCADDASSEQGETQLLQFVPYSKLFSEIEQPSSRAIPDGYQKFSEMYPSPDNNYAKIAIYLADQKKDNTWECEKKGDFTHVAGDSWTSTVHVEAEKQYYVYGYMPSGSANGRITSTDYTKGAELTLSDLSTIVPADVCIIVGVLKGTSSTDDIVTMTELVKPGQYGYKASKSLSDVTDPNDAGNYIYLLMDHIYSCVNLEFAVDDTYNALRTIKLKNVAMQTSSGPSKVTATITLTNSETSPMSCSFTDSGDNNGTKADQLLSEEKDLSGTYLSVPGYFTPGKTPLTFDVISTYDVYDKKGNLVRQNCVATNKITISDSEAAAGKSYTVRLMVTPTYLYQLSEPDLDNPTITVSSN